MCTTSHTTSRHPLVPPSPEKLQAGGGSGLGLWITRALVDLHEGRISVYSAGEGQGTTFTLELGMTRVVPRVGRDGVHGMGTMGVQGVQQGVQGSRDRSAGAAHAAGSQAGPTANAAITLPQQHPQQQQQLDRLRLQPLPLVLPQQPLLPPLSLSNHPSHTSFLPTEASSAVPSGENTPLVASWGKDDSQASSSDVLPPLSQSSRLLPRVRLDPIEATPRDYDASEGEGGHGKGHTKVLKVLAVEERGINQDQGAESRVGEGSEQDSGAAPSTPPLPLYFLVVDDSRLNRRMLVRSLTTQKHLCEEAEDGLQAVQKVQRNLAAHASAPGASRLYDAVLCDFVMPHLDGPGAAREIRALGYTGRIIGCTGNGIPEDIEHFKACGASHVLLKPVAVEDIRRIMTE